MRERFHRYLTSRVMLLTALLAACFLTALGVIIFTAVSRRSPALLPAAAAEAAAAALIACVFYRWVWKPYRECSKVLRLFASGYTINGLFDQDVMLSPEVEAVAKKVEEIMKTDKLISASKKQAQYLALQNQINPHFLYNTLEGIRGETLSAGLENVAKMTEALATFFQYTISKVENLVQLEDELTNVTNYYIIQRYRFGDRLNLSVEYDEKEGPELMSCRMPKLILQPIVENAIYHGIEKKIGRGEIRIRIESTPQRLIITISDNGVGMTEERLSEINAKLRGMSFDYVAPAGQKTGGIAVVNVNSRIKLLFGEEYGVCMYSTLDVGTDVEITLPLLHGADAGEHL